jgi:hypothetical protein
MTAPSLAQMADELEAAEWIHAGERNPVMGSMRLIEHKLLKRLVKSLRALAAPPSEQAAMTSAGDYTTDPIYDGKTLAELAIAPPSDEEVTDAREQYDALLNVLAEHRSTLERLSTAIAALEWKFDAPAIGRNAPLWTELNDAQAQAIALLKGGAIIRYLTDGLGTPSRRGTRR